MPRQKEKPRGSTALPPRVRIKHGSYTYREGGRETVICRVSEGESVLYAALARIKTPAARTVAGLIHDYIAHGSDEIAPATVRSNLVHKNPLIAVFGEMAPNDVEPTDVAQYLEAQKRAGKSVAGNRQISLLSSAYNHGMRNGLCSRNPCRGVRRNKEKPRKRYVENAELQAAIDKASPEFADLLLMAYLTGRRQGDLRRLLRSQITADGIALTEQKTGKQVLIRGSDALNGVLIRCLGRNDSRYILTNTRGQQWSEWGVQSAMRRLGVDWTFHDLRAKAESDHKTGMGLLPLYQRKKIILPVR